MRKLLWTMVLFCFLLIGFQQVIERKLLELPEMLSEPRFIFSVKSVSDPDESHPAETPSFDETGVLYETVKNALLSAAPTVEITGLPGSDSADLVFATVERAVHDNPDILYYEGSKYWSYGRLEFSYRKDRSTILSHQRAVRAKADGIIKRVIKPGMTDYDQVLAIHDYIIQNARYDMENLMRGTLPPESSSPYGVLVEGKGVCEGYAKAMKLIMDRLEIPCLYVTGYADGEGHAWNMVALEGAYYHMDLTWNDPVMPDGGDVLRHDYFNITDREISISHSWDRNAYPACTSTRYNYYYQKGLVVQNPEEFYELLRLSLKNKARQLTFRVLDYDEKAYDIPATIKKIVSQNPGISHKGYTYSLPDNKRIGVVTINFN
jgi:hypothetical protein